MSDNEILTKNNAVLLYSVVATFQSVAKTIKCDHSNESY